MTDVMNGNFVTADGRTIGGVMMEMKSITLRFGGVVALEDISFNILRAKYVQLLDQMAPVSHLCST
jgi:hypothetical protein